MIDYIPHILNYAMHLLSAFLHNTYYVDLNRHLSGFNITYLRKYYSIKHFYFHSVGICVASNISVLLFEI